MKKKAWNYILFCYILSSEISGNRTKVQIWLRSLQMVTAAMKLKETCSLEENL